MMISRNLLKFFRHPIVVLVACGISSAPALAQGPAMLAIPDAPMPASGSASPFIQPLPVAAPPAGITFDHKFWDKQNVALFAATAALSAADFTVTRANLQGGGQELNPVVRMFGRSSAGLALNFAGETAGIVGISYFFHKTGHHRLERAVSMVNLGSSAAAVSYGIASR
jgi:hypothetical protein